MASGSRPQRTNTQRDYLALNSGYEDDILSEDRLPGYPTGSISSFSEFYSANHTVGTESVYPSESASQTEALPSSLHLYKSNSLDTLDISSQLNDIPVSTVSVSQLPKRHHNCKKSTEWIWNYFNITEIDHIWSTRTKKTMTRDRLIQCKKCSWKTRDSTRWGSTTNMETHLRKHHSIFAPSVSELSTDQATIPSMVKKPKLSVTGQLQEDIVQWIIQDKMPFTTVESSAFKQIFNHLPIPDIKSALMSRTTVKRKIEIEFNKQRSQLKYELASTCKSIALLLDLWTSKNQLSVIGVIGHWLTPDFTYKGIS